MKRNFEGVVLILGLLLGMPLWAQPAARFQIEGQVNLPTDGCEQAIVVLCDQASGEPLCRQTLEPFTLALDTTNANAALEWLSTIPDATGHFQFTNIPAGNYTVVAQAGSSDKPVSNLTEFRSETLHLLGRREVKVLSGEARKLQLSPPGNRTVKFDQQFPNNSGLLLLGTHPQRGDAVLGFLGWGTNFISHLIGFNTMPGGRTTVHGLPEEVYASIFMPDNSPGFGSIRLQPAATNVVKMPIVASWSDGYKTPPENLVWLVELVQTNKFDMGELLGIEPNPRASQSVLAAERYRAQVLVPIFE